MLISSDTNIWIDFFEINHPDHPFLLGHKYYLSSAAYDDELIPSDEKRRVLEEYGLLMTDLSDEEMDQAMEYAAKYKKLSRYDTFALAIAKCRSWILLTGDKPLRNAAMNENVEYHGLIWVYDELRRLEKISTEGYAEALQALMISVHEGHSRLPVDELVKRLEALKEVGYNC